MKLLHKVLIGLVGALVITYGVYWYSFPTVTINYRLTVEAMTPNGPKIGSTVIQVSYGSQFNVNGGGRMGDTHVTGEALYLDLGQGKNLFVTLQGDGTGRKNTQADKQSSRNAIYLPVEILELKWDWGNEWSLWRQVRAAESAGPKVVPLVKLPLTVTFRDLADPMSVALVDPQDISAILGVGYAITSASIGITDQGPETSIASILPWIMAIEGGPLDGTRYGKSGTLPGRLNASYFSVKSGKL